MKNRGKMRPAILIWGVLVGIAVPAGAQVPSTSYLGGRIKDGDTINTDAAYPSPDADGYNSRGGGSLTWERDLYQVNGVQQTPWPPPDDPTGAPFLNMTCVNQGLANPTDYHINLTVVPAKDLPAGYGSRNPNDAGVDFMGQDRVGMIAYIYDHWFPGWEAIPSPGGHWEQGVGWVVEQGTPEYIDQQAVSYLIGEITTDLPYNTTSPFDFDGGYVWIDESNSNDPNPPLIRQKADQWANTMLNSGIDFNNYTSSSWELFGAVPEAPATGTDYQNVIIAAPVPEPSLTATVLGLGGALAGIGLRRRSRRHTKAR